MSKSYYSLCLYTVVMFVLIATIGPICHKLTDILMRFADSTLSGWRLCCHIILTVMVSVPCCVLLILESKMIYRFWKRLIVFAIVFQKRSVIYRFSKTIWSQDRFSKTIQKRYPKRLVGSMIQKFQKRLYQRDIPLVTLFHQIILELKCPCVSINNLRVRDIFISLITTEN